MDREVFVITDGEGHVISAPYHGQEDYDVLTRDEAEEQIARASRTDVRIVYRLVWVGEEFRKSQHDFPCMDRLCGLCRDD